MPTFSRDWIEPLITGRTSIPGVWAFYWREAKSAAAHIGGLPRRSTEDAEALHRRSTE